jgi:hypothetical protein
VNTNPAGNTIIVDAQEAPADSNGEFERFEAVLNGLIHTPKKDADEPRKTSTGSR